MHRIRVSFEGRAIVKSDGALPPAGSATAEPGSGSTRSWVGSSAKKAIDGHLLLGVASGEDDLGIGVQQLEGAGAAGVDRVGREKRGQSVPDAHRSRLVFSR